MKYKCYICGSGVTYDLFKLTEEEKELLEEGELDLDDHEFEGIDEPETTVCGAFSESAWIRFEDEDGNDVLTIDTDDIEQNWDLSTSVTTLKNEKMGTIISVEKGTFTDFTLELEDISEFNVDDLELIVSAHDEVGYDAAIIIGIIYKGEEIEFDFEECSTRGIASESFIFSTDEDGCISEMLLEK